MSTCRTQQGKISINNMQGFMVEADGSKASQHFSWSSFIKQLLLTSESIYQTQITNATEP
jgi:hypothetical protein